MKKFLLLVVGAGFLASGIQASAQVLLATTNKGELVEIDLVAGTATLIGDAGRLEGKPADTGWTGLSFDATGNLLAVSRQSGEPNTGCPGSPMTTHNKCSHLYRVDPSNGAVIGLEVRNTETPFLSDIDFAVGDTLFGNQFDGQGTLLTIDPMFGTASAVGYFGTKLDSTGGVVDLQNGGLSVHPVTGELWAIESSFAINGIEGPAIFKVDANTGMVIPPVVPVGILGTPVLFGFDALEILPDGRFIATRGEGRSDVFEINPVPDPSSGLAEITLIPLSLDSQITGSLNGLEFLQASPEPLDALINDIIDLNLRRGVTRTLTRSLDRVKRKLARGELASARDGICVFIDQLNNLVSRGRLTASDASALLKDVSKILGDIAFE